MGHSVSYKKGAWNDMGEAISQMSAWSSGILDHMSAMDQTFRDLRDAVDHLDEDHRVSFSYKSIDGSLDRLRHDYQKLYNYTGDAGEAVSRHIDHPFYTKMDAFIQAMEQISIDKITTKNTINVKQYRPRTSIASVGGAKLLKKEITLDDLFSNSALMDASIKSEYERFKAMTASKQAEKVTFDQYKEAIQYSRSFDYKSIRDKQIDKEFWVNLAVAGGIIILGIVCPPAGIAAGVAYGTMQMTDAVTGTSLISGRKLSTEERVTEGVFGVLDAVPGLKAAGAFGTIGRAGSKGVTKIGELSKALGQSSSSRLMELRTAGRSSIKKVRTAAGERVAHVKQSAEEFADRLSLGGMQPEMAGGYGSSSGRVSARAEDTVQHMSSKKLESVSEEKSKDISRSIEGRYNFDETHDLKGFSKQIGVELKKQGLTLEEFHKLRRTTIDQLTDSQTKSMKAIRDAVPPVTKDTLLQKTITASDIEKYLSGEYTEIRGYVAKVEDVADLRDYDDIVESLRLDYKLKDGSRPFPNGGDSFGIIRFKSTALGRVNDPPYGAKFGGTNTDGPPCTLNGFTGANNNKIVPEFKFEDRYLPKRGSELYKINNGKETLLGIFDGKKFKILTKEKN
jgi:uncharacterized protein YktA (UPF0223 family)